MEITQKAGGLAKKMAAVMAGVKRVRRGGYNEHHKYAFVTAEDVSDMVRDLLAEQGVAFMAGMESYEIVQKEGAKGHVARVKFRMSFVDGDTGEAYETTWFGEAMDSQDKAMNKAATAAVKYFLLKTFLISTGDEPDVDEEGEAAEVSDRVTPEQLAEMRAIVGRMGGTWEKWTEFVSEKAQGLVPESLDRRSAAKWLAMLKQREAKAAGEANAPAPVSGTEDTSRVRSRVKPNGSAEGRRE